MFSLSSVEYTYFIILYAKQQFSGFLILLPSQLPKWKCMCVFVGFFFLQFCSLRPLLMACTLADQTYTCCHCSNAPCYEKTLFWLCPCLFAFSISSSSFPFDNKVVIVLSVCQWVCVCVCFFVRFPISINFNFHSQLC